MNKKRIFTGVLIVFAASVLYLAIFYGLFRLLRSPVLSYLSIVFVSYIAWRRGTVAGGIARSHQGAVYATTQLGKGTTFTMLFPVVAA